VLDPEQYTDKRSLGLVEITYTYTMVPEPAAWVPCAAAGVAGVAFLRRRRAGKSKSGG
jgi:hypothetical protein